MARYTEEELKKLAAEILQQELAYLRSDEFKREIEEGKQAILNGTYTHKKTFSQKEKRQITEFWQKHFPDMGIVKYNMAARIVGPVFFILRFKQENSMGAGYIPKLRLSNLASAEYHGGCAGSLVYDEGGINYKSEDHLSNENIINFKKRVHFRTEGHFNLDDIFKMYHDNYRPHNRDMPLIASWAGEETLAIELFEKYSSHWRDYEIEEVKLGIERPDILRANVLKAATGDLFKKAPRENIIGTPYQEDYTQ